MKGAWRKAEIISAGSRVGRLSRSQTGNTRRQRREFVDLDFLVLF